MCNLNIFWNKSPINQILKEIRNKHKSVVFWFTGLSGSGKSTIANLVEKELYMFNVKTCLLDGDNVRYGLCRDLNFSKSDRKENIRRIAEVINLILNSGIVVLSTFISPYRKIRLLAKNIIGFNKFYEIFIDTSLKTCQLRDPKSLYKKAFYGKIVNFTGISSKYEKPLNPDLLINGEDDLYRNVKNIVNFIKKKIFL